MDSRDIAIIGLSGAFAGARDKDVFWNNIVTGTYAIVEAPDEWAMPWYDPKHAKKRIDNARIGVRHVGLLGDAAEFDPLEFGIPPKAVEGDPAHFLTLRLAADALRDAGYHDRPFNREATGVIVGRGSNPNRGDVGALQYGFIIEQTVEVLEQLLPEVDADTLVAIREELKRSLPPIEIEQVPSVVSNVLTGRIANRLDLMGPNYVVDAACSSSLLAVDHGVRDLLEGRSDMVLAGGVQASMPAQIYMLFDTLGALSESCVRPFDRKANGTLLSEGAGFVVLKRVADAVRDGDRVYAVLKGVGVASDGKALGLLAPRLEGEALALARAYDQTGLEPTTIGLIEAHGTGIPVGDRTEVEALTRVFGERRGRLPSCALGSVKSMIGHCIPAAGIASLIKVALSLHYKVLPPTLCDEVNPDLEIERTPFYVNDRLRPWIHGDALPRRAGINAFGFGGINTHAILEEFVPPNGTKRAGIGRWLVHEADLPATSVPGAGAQSTPPSKAAAAGSEPSVWKRWPSELIVISGATPQEVVDEVQRVSTMLAEHPDVSLADLAHTQARRSVGDCRLAVIATGIEDLARKLEQVAQRLAKGGRREISSRKGVFYRERVGDRPRIAFLFSSEGSQYPDMVADLCLYFPKARGWFDYLDEVFSRSPLPSRCIFPPPTGLSEEVASWVHDQLFAGDLSTESVSTASQAIYEILRDLGVRPDVMLGHSAGEHAALRAAGIARVGSLDRLKEEMRLLNRVYEELGDRNNVPIGKVLSVGALEIAQVEALIDRFEGDLHLVADNCPSQVLMFAKEAAAPAVVEAVREAGGIAMELPFDRAYHTPLFKGGVEALRKYYARQITAAPPLDELRVYSCSAAAPYPEDLSAGIDLAAAQWAKPVRFRETIERLYEEGIRVFVEIGASGSLTAFVENTLRGRAFEAIPADVQARPTLEQFQHLLGRLYVLGVDVAMEGLYAHRATALLEPSDAETSQKSRRTKRVLNMALPKLSLRREFADEIRPRLHPAPRNGGAPPPALNRESQSADLPASVAGADPLGQGRQAILCDHFQLMQEFLRNQQRVLALLDGSAAVTQKDDP